jgi:hypothetical protein
MCNVQRAHKV